MGKQYDVGGKERVYLVFAISLIFSFGFAGNAYAVELSNVSVNPSVAWINPLTGESVVELSAECASNSTANVTAVIAGAFVDSLGMVCNDNTRIYTGTYVLNNFGDYNATITCEYENETDTATVPFSVNLLTIDILSISETEAYAGNISVITAEVLLNGGPLTNGVNFGVSLKDSSNIRNAEIREISFGGGVYELVWAIPAVGQGDYGVDVTVMFDGNSISAQPATYLKIKPPVELEILSPSVDIIYSLTGTTEVEIVLKTKHNPFLIDTLHQSDFCVELGDTELQIDKFTFDSVTDTYSFFVDLYRTEPGEYNYELFACVDPDGFSKQRSDFFVPVEFMVDFGGILQDAKKKPVSEVTIILVKTSGCATYDECVTDSSGLCSLIIHPGTYDIEMVFSDISVKLYGVDLPGEDDSFNRIQDIVRYDRSVNMQIDGLKKITNFVAVDFMLPYDGAKVIMSGAGKQDSQVFMCSKWNFVDSVCLGTWASFDSGINYFANKIEFETDELFAFAIGARDSLKIEMDEYQKKYFSGEDVSLIGIVKDSNGNTVADASIIYSFGETEGSTLSGSDGSFMIKSNAPEAKGVFNALIKVEKSPYDSAKNKIALEAYKKESLDLTIPQSLSASMGNEGSIAARIKNTGQTTMSDVKLTVSGLSSEWYELTLYSIDSLKPGEEKQVTITVLVPLDDCANTVCRQEYDLSISAQSGSEVIATDEFVLYLDGVFDSTDGSKTIETNSGSSENFVSGIASVGNSLTGQAFGAELPGGYLIILFLAVLFAVRKFLKMPKKQNMAEKPHFLDKAQADEIKAEVLRGAKESNTSANPKSQKSGKTGRKTNKTYIHSAKKDIKTILSNPFD